MDEPSAHEPPDPLIEAPDPEHHHRDITGGRERAAVFGISDGLVTNISLILGVAGADVAPGFVRLAGLAGLIAGAASMAAGEYVSMTAQNELFERELELERREHKRNPNVEIVELASIYQARGIDPDTAREMATDIMKDPELALETHAREELGISPDQLGQPMSAAVWSFAAFSFGALLPLTPWFITSGAAAVIASAVLATLCALAVGGALARLTERPLFRTAARQWLFAAVPAAVTWTIGSVIGVSA